MEHRCKQCDEPHVWGDCHKCEEEEDSFELLLRANDAAELEQGQDYSDDIDEELYDRYGGIYGCGASYCDRFLGCEECQPTWYPCLEVWLRAFPNLPWTGEERAEARRWTFISSEGSPPS